MTASVIQSGPYRYGGFWWRVLAYIIDIIILSIGAGIVGGILGGVVGATAGADPNSISAAQAISGLVVLVLEWLYFALLESSNWRGTVGKRAVGLIVVDEHGRRISFGRATGRFFSKIISGVILLIGFMMAGWNHKKRALHDMIAGTLVLKRNDSAAAVGGDAVTLPA
jgi:uncharacterized RDD family membrane protein YckC